MRSKKAIYNIIGNLVLQFVIIIYGFIVPRIIISYFGSEVNGLISSITQFLAYISLLESGFGPVLMAALYKPISRRDKKEIQSILYQSERFFKSIASIFIIYIIILCILYPLLVSKSFETFYTISLIIIISAGTFAEYFFGITYKLYLQAEQKSYIVSIIQIITYILSVISVIVLAYLGASIHLIKLISGILFVLRPIFQNIYVKKKYNIIYDENTDKNYDIKQKWDGLAQHIASVIHSNTDITVLTIFCDISMVSIYSVYYLVVKGIKAILQAISNGIDATFGNIIANGEKENLKNKFSVFELFYNSISIVAFSCAIVLIVPFVTIYTIGVTDANYIRYSFGILLVISEYIWAVRQPYNMLIKVAGHFKETRIGAWIECVSNILISVILVKKYGLIGVAIGTIVAMLIRTIEFIYHSNKYILGRPILESIKKIILIILETIIIVLICKYIPYLDNINYVNWIINALMTLLISLLVVISFDFMFFKSELKSAISILKKVIKVKKKCQNIL